MNRDTHAFDIQEAWEHVGYLYGCIVSLFGAPFAIAARLILMRKSRRDLLAWLGPVEALARRILLLRALGMPQFNAPPLRAASGRVLIAFTDKPQWGPEENAEKWRVVFRVAPPLERRHLAGKPSPAGSRRSNVTFNALPLARRIEALRRVLENPRPALARLARLLTARREAIAFAFRPYHPRAACAQEGLANVQREIERALNTS